MNNQYSVAAQVAQRYYDTPASNQMYSLMWGGEHIHYGIYANPTTSLAEASALTVQKMAQLLNHITPESRVIDLGAGYGGTARYLAKTYGCQVSCLNISTLQNERNRQLNQAQGLAHLVEVQDGSFETIPYSDRIFDVVWSQDAMLHSTNRRGVLTEIKRVLKQGGDLIFTDPLQSPTCPPGMLQSAFERIGIDDMSSYRIYGDTLRELGFEEVQILDLSEHPATHYKKLKAQIESHYEEAVSKTSAEFVENSLSSIQPWIDYYEKGYMQWGILHFRLR